MKKSVKGMFFAVLSVVFVFGMTMFSACSGGGGGSSSSSSGGATTYSGTIYQASQEGGHIGVFTVTIDPSNTTTPVTVDTATQSKIQINGAPADTANHLVFHDVRFDDATNPTKIYYSAIMSRPATTLVGDIGYVDLTQANTAATNNGINSVIDIDGPAADTIAFALHAMAPNEFGTTSRILYCASGMDKTNGYYFPMSMSFPAYVDAVPLAKLNNGAKGGVSNELHSGTTDFTRTYIDQIDADAAGWARIQGSGGADLGTPPLGFIHGGSSPDGSKVYMVTNVVSGLSTTNNLAGVIRAYIVNSTDLETASSTTPGISAMDPSKVVTKTSYTVAPSDATTSGDGSLQGTIVYRATYTPDGKYILQSASDRLLIFNANDLSVYADTGTTSNANSVTKPGAITSGLGKGTDGGIEVHGVTSTPDSNYAILSLRYYADATQAAAGGAGSPGIKSSGVQIYDINNKAFIGGVVPTCGSSAAQCHAATGDFRTRATCGILFKAN